MKTLFDAWKTHGRVDGLVTARAGVSTWRSELFRKGPDAVINPEWRRHDAGRRKHSRQQISRQITLSLRLTTHGLYGIQRTRRSGLLAFAQRCGMGPLEIRVMRSPGAIDDLAGAGRSIREARAAPPFEPDDARRFAVGIAESLRLLQVPAPAEVESSWRPAGRDWTTKTTISAASSRRAVVVAAAKSKELTMDDFKPHRSEHIEICSSNLFAGKHDVSSPDQKQRKQ